MPDRDCDPGPDRGPDTVLPPPAWFAAAAKGLVYLAGQGKCDPLDAGLLIGLLRSVEAEHLPAPNVAGYPGTGTAHAWWSRDGRCVSAVAVAGLAEVIRCEAHADGSWRTLPRPAGPPRHPAALLREDLGWLHDRLCGGHFEWQVVRTIEEGERAR